MKFTIPHIAYSYGLLRYRSRLEAPYAVVRLYIALRYEGDGEAELGHGSSSRGSGSRTMIGLAYSFLAKRPFRRKSDPSQHGYPDIWIAPVDWERNVVLNFLDGRQQLTVKAAENVAKGLALVWVRVDLQGLALQGQHEDAPAL